MSGLSVNAIKAFKVSDDGLQTTITFTTKYVGDLDVTMPSSCVDDLISAARQAKPEKPSRDATDVKAPTDVRDVKDPKDATQLTVAVPKTWLVLADTAVHQMVILAFDHQAETKTAYALHPDAAKKLAEVLVQKAGAILAHKANGLNDKPEAAH
jgi:hypothetical protein